MDDDITNRVLESILYPERHKKDEERLIPDYPRIHRELAKKGVTLSLLWTEYCMEARNTGKIPYMSTQFNDNYHKWARVSKATMRIQHKPGDTMEVDWAGTTIDIYDPVTGEVTPAYLFVAVLSCSCYVYAEICINMKSDTFINCHVHAYEYFGGVTRLLIPDNLKTGITRNTRYETTIPRAYKEMAEHYNTAIVPARVKHPDDKPNAEGSVRFATTWILAALRNYHFFSLEEAKIAVSEKLEELNNRSFTKRAGNRRIAFENEEKEFMQQLPLCPYEPAVWSTAKVQNDYLISDGINKYSAPFDLIGEHVDIRCTDTTVEVFFHGSRVASQVRRAVAQRDPISIKEHMPPEHRKYLAYNPEEFKTWAERIGDCTSRVVNHFLYSDKEPEQGYKYCVSLMKMTDRYEKQLEELRKELTKSLTGDSIYDKEDIAIAITDLKSRMLKDREELDKLGRIKDDKEKVLEQFFPTLKKVRTWAEEFENASLEEKKMICSTVFKRIEVGKGYEISLTLNSKYEDFFEEWGKNGWSE